MKTRLSKTEAKEKISEFFQRSDFSPEELRKIKRIAMKFNIRLTPYRKSFCKTCFNPLSGKVSISKTHKTIECKFCKFKNKAKIK